jgi:hypothetical protein
MHRRQALGWLVAAGAGAVATATRAAETQGAAATPAAPRPRANVNALVVNYIAAWNEQDPKRRLEIVAKTWTDGGTYVDAHRRGEGHESIDAMIATAQRSFPGYRIRLVSKVETHNGFFRFSWAAGGTEQAPLYLAGTDFVTVAADGRIASVTGFVDAAPAPAGA